MAYALVGSLGAVVQSTSGGSITTLAYGQTPTANNLLILWIACAASANTPGTPSGWTSWSTGTGISCGCAILYKVAAGGDSAPTISAITSSVQSAMLGEFSGNDHSNPQDQAGGASGTTTPISGNTGVVDQAAGGLVITCSSAFYSSSSGTKTTSDSLNNGATAHTTTNTGTSVNHYDFCWGITTSNASADSESLTVTTTHLTGCVMALGSFKMPPPPVIVPNLSRITSQAVNRASNF